MLEERSRQLLFGSSNENGFYRRMLSLLALLFSLPMSTISWGNWRSTSSSQFHSEWIFLGKLLLSDARLCMCAPNRLRGSRGPKQQEHADICRVQRRAWWEANVESEASCEFIGTSSVSSGAKSSSNTLCRRSLVSMFHLTRKTKKQRREY